MSDVSANHPAKSTCEDPNDPLVSIIIVSWNALETVKQCLPSVTRTAYKNLEILFADNASTDGTLEWVEANLPSVKIIRHPENWAFCRGNNAAAQEATGEFIVLLNNDVEVPSGWLDPLVAQMQADPAIGAVQPKLLSYSERNQFEYAGGAGGFLDRNGFPFTRGRLFFTLENDTGQYDQARNIFWATGAAIMIRKDLFDRLGGLDERLFMHMEEIDFCWRLQRHGFRVVCEPASSVYHIGGASLEQGSTRKVFLNYRNNLLVLFKNLSPRAWSRVIITRLVLDGIAMIRALILLRPGETLAIFRAYLAAHRMKKMFAADRPSQDERSIGLPYRGNIVFDYFLLGRRRFSDLPTDKFSM